MNNRGTRTLETSRLVLRRFTPEDAPAMFANWASDPEVTKYLTWPTHTSADITAWVVNSWCQNYAQPNYYHWCITLKGKDEAIGDIAVVEQKEIISCAEVGYCLGRKWWHQGIMSEALQAVMTCLFEDGYQRVEAGHDVSNPHSGDVMKKCGMRYEGTHRKAGKNNQGIVDMALYAMLVEDR